MRVAFLGTRGEIEARSRAHRRHSAVLIEHGAARVMIDCGTDWLRWLRGVAPTAILLTHAHPDHAGGLADGCACPVFATKESWRRLDRFPIAERHRVQPRRPFTLGALAFEAFPVEHSTRAPAVGYRAEAAGARLFYVPDVVSISDRKAALRVLDLFIGDGASLTRPIIRQRGDARIGHTTIEAQLGWCRDEGVGRAIFTHCGTQIVAADGRRIAAMLGRLARAAGVEARIAHDGLSLDISTGRLTEINAPSRTAL